MKVDGAQVIGPRPIASRADFETIFAELLDRWAERRCYAALRPMLNGAWFGAGLADDWERVRAALRNVIAEAGAELTPEERDALDESVAAVDIAFTRRDHLTRHSRTLGEGVRTLRDRA